MSSDKFSKQELAQIAEALTKIVNIVSNVDKIDKYVSINQDTDDDVLPSKNRKQNENLESLIGTIPFLLLNEDVFEKNQDIALFAQRLNIFIPSPEKKKREDIIGRIIASISKFDDKRISELTQAIKSLNSKSTTKNKNSFFREWEEVIKKVKL